MLLPRLGAVLRLLQLGLQLAHLILQLVDVALQSRNLRIRVAANANVVANAGRGVADVRCEMLQQARNAKPDGVGDAADKDVDIEAGSRGSRSGRRKRRSGGSSRGRKERCDICQSGSIVQITSQTYMAQGAQEWRA
ncbi:hypothetical protein Tdes44962_MAKER08252 [Teratosphaeria destructans]|uniref:Secreted protein n=1 Tax=Teratosphaeria destructans TaxID=418781 RepID=A0A9W7SXG6_9PEZI|nr:hypothetical protein Tdes44962_MAKER08252 [Teratosphaeria destructans]